MSYRRNQAQMEQRLAEQTALLRPVAFEIVGHNGLSIAHCQDTDEVYDLVHSYRMNAEIRVVGLNALGHEVRDWNVHEVLNGTLDADLVA